MMHFLSIEPINNYNEVVNFLKNKKIQFESKDNEILLNESLLEQLKNLDLIKNYLCIEDNDGSSQELDCKNKYQIKSGILDQFGKELLININSEDIPFYLVIYCSA